MELSKEDQIEVSRIKGTVNRYSVPSTGYTPTNWEPAPAEKPKRGPYRISVGKSREYFQTIDSAELRFAELVNSGIPRQAIVLSYSLPGCRGTMPHERIRTIEQLTLIPSRKKSYPQSSGRRSNGGRRKRTARRP
jgi:hypothetical protein